MKKCKHENGWICKEEFCVGIDTNIDDSDYQLIADFQCNNLDCKKIKRFRFGVCNFREIK